MLKDKLYIHDSMFTHSKSSSWYNEPSEFEWVREYDNEHLVLTDLSVEYIDSFSNKNKYAWLLESPSITPSAYNYIINNYTKFDCVFTFDKELLDMSNNFEFVPCGGCWIDKSNRLIHKKSKLTSIILSHKKSTLGHQLRHAIHELYPKIDSYGFNNPISNKIDGLRDYMFSIVIENCKKDYYFTEKLIDSFMTGTIPIYWGCPSIGNFFNIDGILIFNDITELKYIMNNISIDLYNTKINAARENYNKALEYLVADDTIYKKIKSR